MGTTDQVRAALTEHLKAHKVRIADDGMEWDEPLERVLNDALGDNKGTALVQYIAREAASMAVYFTCHPRVKRNEPTG